MQTLDLYFETGRGTVFLITCKAGQPMTSDTSAQLHVASLVETYRWQLSVFFLLMSLIVFKLLWRLVTLFLIVKVDVESKIPMSPLSAVPPSEE